MMVMLGNDKTNIKTDGQVGVVIDGMSRGVVELYNCGLYIRLVWVWMEAILLKL